MPIHEIRHPLVRHKIGLMREAVISTKKFRELTAELARLLTYEACRDYELERTTIQGWAGPVEIDQIKGKKVTIVPILRAGLGMVEGLLKFMPMAKVGHIGLYRDHDTLKPVEYYCKLPTNVGNMDVFVLDPMLATGGSVAAAIDIVKKTGAKKINFLCIVSCPEGVKHLTQAHPDVKIFTCVVDDHLNEHGYIVPGLGDAGDRLYGTK